jgi:hypothetical protein
MKKDIQLPEVKGVGIAITKKQIAGKMNGSSI